MKIRDKIFFLIIALTALTAALFLSPLASGFPDGLEKTAERLGFADKSSGFVNFKFMIPGYLFPGVNNTFWQKSIAGFFGILIIFALFAFILWITVLAKKIKNRKK